MKDKLPPLTPSMDLDVSDALLPNRHVRRAHKKLKKKKHYREQVATNLKGSSLVAEEEPKPQPKFDPALTEALLANLDVKRFLEGLNGLLTGTKRLVIETTHYAFDGQLTHPVDAYTAKHTFKVEDIDEQRG